MRRVARPVGEASAERFLTDLQRRTFEKHVKTLGFCRFFITRSFFERVGLLDGKSIEKAPKSTFRRAQIVSRWTKSLPGALFERLRATKPVENASSNDLGSTLVARSVSIERIGAISGPPSLRAPSRPPECSFANSNRDILIIYIYIYIYT